MKPSSVLHAYRVGQRHARSINCEFKVSKARLQGWGWTEAKIDALFRAIEQVDELEAHYAAISADLDKRFA